MEIRRSRWTLALAAVLAAGACTLAPMLGQQAPPRHDLADGVYVGKYSHFLNAATVRVTVAYGRIAAVEVLHHGGSWIGNRAVPVIPNRIVEAQSTEVDAVSGATNSSRVIMNAAQKAVEQAATAARAERRASEE